MAPWLVIIVPAVFAVLGRVSKYLDVRRLPFWLRPVLPFFAVAGPMVDERMLANDSLATALLVGLIAGLAQFGVYHEALKPAANKVVASLRPPPFDDNVPDTPRS